MKYFKTYSHNPAISLPNLNDKVTDTLLTNNYILHIHKFYIINL